MGKKSREKRGRENYYPAPPKTKLENICLKVIEWGTYLALVTPLIVNSNFYYPFVTVKAVFFRVLVDIILAAYLLLLAVNSKYKPRMNWLSWSIIGFLAVSMVSAITGDNFVRSFWGTFERMTGVLTLLHLSAFFLVITSVFKERKFWERVMTVSIVIGIILTLMVYLSNDPTTKGGGTLGNTSFMSAYIIFDIFFAMMLFFTKKGGPRIFYGIALFATVFLLLAPPREPTQGAIGAFFGGLVLLVILYLFCRSVLTNNNKLRNIVIASVAILVLLGAFISQTSLFKEKIGQITQSSSWQSRMIVWKIGIDTWLERPWFGWGEENFIKGFSEHYEPSLALTNDLWYDRAHNIVIDSLVSFGIVGLLSYLSIFGIAVVKLLKSCRNFPDKKDIIFPLGLISLLVVYFVQNIWVFDMVATYVMFFIALSLIYFFTAQKTEEIVEETQYKRPYVLVFGLLIVLVLNSIYWCNLRPLQAAHYLVRARALTVEESVEMFNKGVMLSPMSWTEGAEQFSSHLAGLVFNEKVNKNDLTKGFLESGKRLREAIEKNPNNFRLYLTLGKHYNNFYGLVRSVDLLDSAREALDKARELSPRNQQVYWEIAQNELYRGDKDKSIEYLNESINLEPGYNFSYWYLGLVYRVLGENELAWENMKIARDKGFDWSYSLSDIIKVISVNQALDNHEELIPLYEAALELDPENAKLAGGMALSYANLGEYQKASQMAKYAVELDPSLKEDLQPIIDLWE